MRRVAYLFPVALLAVALYAVTLGHGFVWDDRSLIVENRYLSDWSELGANVTSDFFRRSADPATIGYWRPVVTLSYMIDRSLGGESPLGFHLTNVLLHVLASCLVALLATRLGMRWEAAMGCGLLFAIHPVHVESVAWISGRTDLFCTVFVLAALLLDADEKRSSRAVSVAATALAVLSKEMAAIVPLLIALRVVLFPGRRGAGPGAAVRRALPHAVVVAAYLAVRFGVLGLGTHAPAAADSGRLALFLTWWSGALEYLRVLVWPLRLGIVPPVALEHGVSIRVAAGFLALSVPLVLAWRTRRTAPAVAFGSGLLLIAMVPLTNFLVPINAPAANPFPWAERYLYLPSVGFSIVLCGLLLSGSRTERIPRWALAVFATVTTLGAARAAVRVADWKDDLHLFRATVRVAPDSARAHLGLGVALAESGNREEAEQAYLRVLALAPDSYKARFNLGNLRRERGDLVAAESDYRAALSVHPTHARSWNNLGLVLVQTRRFAEALDAFERADAALPDYAEAKLNRANALRLLDRAEESIPLYREALAVDPTLAPARDGLAAALRETGRLE